MSQFQIKTELEFAVSKAQNSRMPKCQLCGRKTYYLHLHHIINRSYIPKKKIEELSIVFHALLCEQCHIHGQSGVIDTPDTRAKLVASNAEIFGWDKVEQAFLSLDKMLPNGIPPGVIDINKVKEYYEQSKSDNS